MREFRTSGSAGGAPRVLSFRTDPEYVGALSQQLLFDFPGTSMNTESLLHRECIPAAGQEHR